jgi:hypothetical protein
MRWWVVAPGLQVIGAQSREPNGCGAVGSPLGGARDPEIEVSLEYGGLLWTISARKSGQR